MRTLGAEPEIGQSLKNRVKMCGVDEIVGCQTGESSRVLMVEPRRCDATSVRRYW